jgi:DNA-directed RNA polymerase subunit beta'
MDANPSLHLHAAYFGKETKGKQRVIITDSEGEQYETLVPKWRHITVSSPT